MDPKLSLFTKFGILKTTKPYLLIRWNAKLTKIPIAYEIYLRHFFLKQNLF